MGRVWVNHWSHSGERTVVEAFAPNCSWIANVLFSDSVWIHDKPDNQVLLQECVK